MASSSRRPTGFKRKLVHREDDEDDGGGTAGAGDFYRFKVLLPNGAAVGLRLLVEPKVREKDVKEFIRLVQGEYLVSPASSSSSSYSDRRPINWKSPGLFLQDSEGTTIRQRVMLSDFGTGKCHILMLHDGSALARDVYDNMWDITLDAGQLNELPTDYTFEAALADLIDNSVQAVWAPRRRRLIRVDILKDRICIFDSGSGMDDSDNKSITKWGKMGAISLPSSLVAAVIARKPPYLMPAFGMSGFEGAIASMYLGRKVIVSSKTSISSKVYTLHLNKEAFMNCPSGKLSWKINGGMRNPFKDETENAPHGSFTKVEIFGLKMKNLDELQIRCNLKDIYFPYIQCDEASAGKTRTLIEFQVNGVNLAEVEGGQVSITNLHTCIGPEFVFELSFSAKQGSPASKFPGLSASSEANARVKCVYFPIREGKENIDRILESLKAEGVRTKENYETFSRVSVRWLGRLLPDARWASLPFMEPMQKKGEKAHLLRRCYSRVKCFIDTDGGFNPTQCKMNLACHNPFTMALKNIGCKTVEKKTTDVNVKISLEGKVILPSQLEKKYQEWILHMHDHYDEEFGGEEFCGADDPVVVVGPTNKKKLRITSDAVRVHKKLKRKGISWEYGQRMKLLKWACHGVHDHNIFVTLEYFLIEGLPGDPGGDARIVCRPIGVSEDDGCKIVRDDEENASLDIGESLSLPISVIDSEKCQRLTETVWIHMLEKERQKGSFVIDLLCEEQCKQLGVLGALPVNTVDAGYNAPEEIIAVFRPASYNSSDSRDIINQSDILKMDLLMSMEVEYESEVTNSKTTNIYSTQLAPSEHQGYHGLYVYQLRRNIPCLFQKAGIYTFSFLSNDPKCTNCKKRIVVRASSEVKMWKILFSEQIEDLRVSVGSSFPPLSIGGFDAYENRISFVSAPDVKVELLGDDNVLFQEEKVKPVLLSDGLIVQVKDFLIKAHNLDTIRPNYKATLVILPGDGLVSLLLPCQVFPGSVKRVKAQGSSQRLLPNSVTKELNLEMFDSYGNHAKEGTEVQLVVDGFCFVGKATSEFKVDENGCIDLSQQLKATAGYGEVASISVLFRDKEVFRQEYHIEISSPQQDEKLLLVHNPPTQEISYPEQDEKPLLPHNLLPQEIVQNMVKLFMDIHKDRERDMLMCGKEVGDCERELEALRNRRAEIKESLASLQATLGPDNLNCPVTEEEVLESIKDQIHSAASLVCYLSRDFTFSGPQVSFVDDIVGVVALLGTVRTSEQSRILSSYLDKDHMLAVVCRSSDAASALEKYDENGDIDLELGLHAEAAVLDTRIHHQFLVICLDNIRPYKGKVASDSQRKLLLPVPVLGNGKIPAGFMGHAVNMIKINDRHLETRTAEGFGLRETLFYRLFGDLQVYETRNHMRAAQSCIREGAVSLDGGMIRGNGIASLGCRSCDVRFRVTELSYGQPIPPEWLEAKMQYEREKTEIEQVEAAIEKCTRRHEKIMKRFQQSTESCYKLTSIVPCGRNFGLS